MAEPITKPDRDTPLCIDLDGTLIRTDMLFETLLELVSRNPFYLLAILFWWTGGRARLKAEIARRVDPDPAALPYNRPLIDFVLAERARGRKALLVTASDAKIAERIAGHAGIFDGVLASDGKRNLRGKNKGETLAGLFGERGFDYAGNSSVDLPVWRRSRKAIVVNGSKRLVARAAECSELGPVFPPSVPLAEGLVKTVRPQVLLLTLLVWIPVLVLRLKGPAPSWLVPGLVFAGALLCTAGGEALSELLRLHNLRQHATRKLRPFPAGDVPIQAGAVAGPLVVIAGTALAGTQGWGQVAAALSYSLLTVMSGDGQSSRAQKWLLLAARCALLLLSGGMASVESRVQM